MTRCVDLLLLSICVFVHATASAQSIEMSDDYRGITNPSAPESRLSPAAPEISSVERSLVPVDGTVAPLLALNLESIWCLTRCSVPPNALITGLDPIKPKLASEDYQERQNGLQDLLSLTSSWFNYIFSQGDRLREGCAFEHLEAQVTESLVGDDLEVVIQVNRALSNLKEQVTAPLPGASPGTYRSAAYIGSVDIGAPCDPPRFWYLCRFAFSAATAGCNDITDYECHPSPRETQLLPHVRAKSSNCESCRVAPDISGCSCPTGYEPAPTSYDVGRYYSDPGNQLPSGYYICRRSS